MPHYYVDIDDGLLSRWVAPDAEGAVRKAADLWERQGNDPHLRVVRCEISRTGATETVLMEYISRTPSRMGYWARKPFHTTRTRSGRAM